MDVHSQLQVLIYTTQYIRVWSNWVTTKGLRTNSEHWFSQVAEIAKTCHIFKTWSFTYTSFDFKYWKKKKLSATILTLKPMCRLCTLYSPTKRILQMKSKLNLKSGKPVMWTSVWLHFYTQILEVDGCWKALLYIIRTQSWNQRNSWTTLE